MAVVRRLARRRPEDVSTNYFIVIYVFMCYEVVIKLYETQGNSHTQLFRMKCVTISTYLK